MSRPNTRGGRGRGGRGGESHINRGRGGHGGHGNPKYRLNEDRNPPRQDYRDSNHFGNDSRRDYGPDYGRQDGRYEPNADYRHDMRHSPNTDYRHDSRDYDRRDGPNIDYRHDRRDSPNRNYDRRYYDTREGPNTDYRQDRRYSPNRDRRYSPSNRDNRDRRYSPPNRDRRYSPNRDNRDRRYSPNRDRRPSPNRDNRDRRYSPNRDYRNRRHTGSPNRDTRDRRHSPNRDRRPSPDRYSGRDGQRDSGRNNNRKQGERRANKQSGQEPTVVNVYVNDQDINKSTPPLQQGQPIYGGYSLPPSYQMIPNPPPLLQYPGQPLLPNPAPLMSMSFPTQPPPYSACVPTYGSNLTRLDSTSNQSLASNSSRHSHTPRRQDSGSSNTGFKSDEFPQSSNKGSKADFRERSRGRGRGRGPGRGQGRGGSRGRAPRRRESSASSDKGKLESIGSDVAEEKATKNEKKESFLFFIFKGKSDESFDYVAYLKSRTESLKSIEYEIQAFLKTGNSKVILGLFQSKTAANRVIKHFRKTNSSSDVEVLCYMRDNLPPTYQDLAKVNLDEKIGDDKLQKEEALKGQELAQKPKKKRKQQKKVESTPETHETTLYLRIDDAVKSQNTEGFIKTRMGSGTIYPFQLVSSTLSDNGSSTNIEIKVPSEAIADIIIRQLEESNTNSSTNVVCSLIPVTSDSTSNREMIQQVLSDITTKSNQRLEHHRMKITEASNRIEEFVISQNVSFEEYSRKVAERDAIKAKLDELKSQELEYQKYIKKITNDISKSENMENFKEHIRQLSKQFSIECCRLDTALPIYARRSDILSCIANNQVIILRGATGSGKSTQIAQYLFESDLLKDKMVVCTQPRKVACVSLATRVSEELLSKLSKTVGYRTGVKQRTSKDTKILFMTDHTLLNECLKDPLFTNYSVIIIDEAHERSIYTDLLLGIVKKCLPQRPDLKVIISSATIDIEVFTKYFQPSRPIEVAGRTFPVEVVWKAEHEQSTDNYEDEAVKMAIQVHEDEGPGDILIFMTTPLETEKCKERFEAKFCKANDSFKCLTLHGQLSIQEQQQVFQPLPEHQRKIVFATNTAETSITIQGIKYVIDTGLAKEMNFDPKRNINCLAVSVISQSSADQRKGRAGRTSPGKCYRLYTEQTFLDMKKSNVPEILRVHLGQALLKLLQFGINPFESDFVESPSQDALDAAYKTLVQLNAVEHGKITDHGNWLAKVPCEPRLSTIVKKGFDEGFVYDALVLASLISSGSSIFYRGGSEDEKDKSDLVKTQFCQPQGDCFTLLRVYKEWIAEPEAKRNAWCFQNYVNSKAIRGVHDTVSEISGILKRELGIEVKKEFSDDKDLEERIQKIILLAFSDNIAHFTGHRKVGYFVPSLDQQVFIHPSSSLKVLNDSSEWVVFCNVLRTSTDFITIITPVKEQWIEEMMKLHFDIEDVKSRQISIVHIEYFGSSSFSMFVGPRFTKLRKYEELLSQICGCIVMIDADRDRGEARFYASTFSKTAKEAIAEWRNEAVQPVLMKTEEYQLGSKRTRTGGVRIVLGKGGEGTLLLMPLEYRSVDITKPNCQTSSKENIKKKFSRFGEIVDCWEDKKSDGRWGRVTFSSDTAARLAVTETRHDDVDVAVPEIKQSERREFQFKARLTWSRRPSKNFAFVDVNPIHLADIVGIRLSVKGQAVQIEINEKSAGLILRRLPPYIKEANIKENLCAELGFTTEEEKAIIKKVSIMREKVEATSVNEVDTIKRTIIESISNYLDGQTRFVVNVLKPKKDTDINFTAFAQFYSAEDGYLACDGLNGTMRINNQPVAMIPDVSSSINISQQVYDVMKSSIDEAVEALHKILDFRFHEKELNNGRVILNLYSKASSDLARLRAILDGILKGEVIECWRNENYRHLFLRQGRQFIRKVEEKTQTVIRMDERMNSISIFGTKAKFTTAQIELENYLNDIVNGNGKEIDLRDPARPRGLMKALVKQYGFNLETLVEYSGLQSILLNHKRQTVKIIGESEALEKACHLIDGLSESLLLENLHFANAVASAAGDQGDALPECCTCLCPIDRLTELYRLENCSHPYCLDCFKRQIQFAIQSKDLPILCSEVTCQKPFTWVDFKQSFTKVQIDHRALVGAAVTNFMMKRGRGTYHHCLTPDCPVIYKTNEENSQYICEECGIRICSSCHIEYHDGLSCAMYKSQEMDRDQIETYLRQHADSVKPCPQCRVPIEKNRGCNHIVCQSCKVDFCWLCTAKFMNAAECYDHLTLKHGGIAGIDDLLYN